MELNQYYQGKAVGCLVPPCLLWALYLSGTEEEPELEPSLFWSQWPISALRSELASHLLGLSFLS